MDPIIRSMCKDEWAEVAALIHDSTNAWYTSRGFPAIFPHGPDSTLLFCEVYETLDPGCCLVAEDPASATIVGSCFFHPRSTHFSLGIMNVAHGHFGKGIATRLLRAVLDRAVERNLPTRLVSSALNLDSYSLYNRLGFVAHEVFQDMILTVPSEGIGALADAPPFSGRVRPAVLSDAVAMTALEQQRVGIERQKDFELMLSDPLGFWSAHVIEDNSGGVAGFMFAIRHPASNMLGPGFAGTQPQMLALIYAALQHHRGNQAVVLVPASAAKLTSALYDWGARNCELHVSQVYGDCRAVNGISIPTFMPETA